MNSRTYKGILPYKDKIDETLEWMKDGKTSREFDDWMFEYDSIIEVIQENKTIDGVKYYKGDKIRKPKIQKASAADFSAEGFILGSVSQGLGVNTWAGRLNLVQILSNEGYINVKRKDGVLHYKTIKKFELEKIDE